jgi:hypothetical protein
LLDEVEGLGAVAPRRDLLRFIHKQLMCRGRSKQ